MKIAVSSPTPLPSLNKSMGYDNIFDELSTQWQSINIYWNAGANKYAEYFIEHISSSHHKQVRSTYVLKNYDISSTEHSRESMLIYQDITPCGSPDISLGCSVTHDPTIYL